MMERVGKVVMRTWILLGFAYVLLPLVLVVWMSFFASEIPRIPPQGYTLSWYARAFENPQFSNSFLFSLQVALFSAVLGLLVSVPATIVLRRSQSVFAATMVQFLTAPLIVPTIVIGAGIYIGLVLLEMMTEIPAVGSVWALGLAHTLITIPWCTRLLLANLSTLDGSVEEAAASLGANPLTVLLTMTLPLIRSGVVAAALFSFVVSFGNIELSLFLVAPGQMTLPIAILQYLEWKLDPTVSAVSVAQILLIAGGLLIADRYVKLTRVV